jgi:hypothetical protein
MNPQRSIEYLTGFIMGFVGGVAIDGLLSLILSIIKLTGGPQINLPCWSFLPLPIVSGLIMSKAIADLHLEDY